MCLWWLLGGPTPVYYPLRHRYQEVELEVLERLERAVPGFSPVIRDPLPLRHLERPDAHIDYRNLLLVSFEAANGASTVYLGAVKGESSRDKSRRFLRDASRLLTYLEKRRVRVLAPGRRYTKAKLFRVFLRSCPDGERWLRITRSCYALAAYDERVVGCGECMACFRRWVAMSLNGVEEDYLSPPWESALTTDVRLWRRHLSATSLPQLPGVLANNLQAWRALRRR